MIWHWFLHVTGTKIPANGSYWYNWHSGFGSDLGEYAIIAAVLGAWHHHNCHQPRCWKLSRHVITDSDGVTHGACRKHREHVLTKVSGKQDDD